jgi:hypothetical protein
MQVQLKSVLERDGSSLGGRQLASRLRGTLPSFFGELFRISLGKSSRFLWATLPNFVGELFRISLGKSFEFLWETLPNFVGELFRISFGNSSEFR